MKLNELTIIQAHEGIKKKDFSVTELVSACLDAIRNKNEDIHAYLDVYYDDALAKAKKADEKIAGAHYEELQNLPALFGIPIAVKDNILIEGKRCTAGSKMLDNYFASYDATVIERLKKRGAIFLGKTNMDEFAMGSSTENSAFGPTKNPHDITRVPGGSSGGSAAAVAANICIAALGSDTGGSIRQPAAFCGIVGMKPTYGAVSRHGLIAMASSLDQIGPMTKNVEDAKILFDTIAGKDDFDATSAEIKNSESETKNPGGFRVGVPKEYFGSGLDSELSKIIKSAVKKLEESGAIIEEIHLPHSYCALPCYYIIMSSEVSSNLARYDGIRYGHQEKEAKNLFDAYAKSRDILGKEVKRRIVLGTYTLSAGYYDAYYIKAQKVRQLIRNDFERAFERVDVILGPTTPTPAFHLGAKMDNPLEMYLADIYTAAVNLAGNPALSLPVGYVMQGESRLPAGIQLIGKWFEDKKLLTIAKIIEGMVWTIQNNHQQ